MHHRLHLIADIGAAFALATLLFAISSSGNSAPLHQRQAQTAADIDWPHFRFDDLHTGFNPNETVLSKNNVKFAGIEWQAQLGDLVDFSSPAIVDGVAYMASSDGTLWAYSASGCGQDLCTTPLWQSTSLAQIIDSPAVADGIVYIGSQTSDDDASGKLNAFAAAGCGNPVCAPLWQGDAGSQSILSSSPTVADGVVYIGGFDGKLYAFDAEGCGQALCQPIWSGATGGSIESTPTVYKGVVFVGSDDGKLYAFKAKGCGKPQCKPKWTGDLGGAVFQSSPAVSMGVVYIAQQHAILAFDAKGCGAKTCTPLWQGVEDIDFFGGSPAIYKHRVYIPLESGIAVYDARGCGQSLCDRLWLLFGSGFQAGIVSAPTVANGVVYATRNTGDLLAWAADPCGQPICLESFKSTPEGQDPVFSSSPSVLNGKIYVGGTDDRVPEDISGRLYVYHLTD